MQSAVDPTIKLNKCYRVWTGGILWSPRPTVRATKNVVKGIITSFNPLAHSL